MATKKRGPAKAPTAPAKDRWDDAREVLIVAGTPIENIEAFLDEALVYGTAHRRQF